MSATEKRAFIELKADCERQMRLDVCNGCDLCGLRCAVGISVTRDEWDAIQDYIAGLSDAERAEIEQVQRQDKQVDLGDGVTVPMCRYRDRERGRCAVYAARPLVCRLLGHVEWMPCPIAKVPRTITTPDALALMRAYAQFERRTFEAWEAQEMASADAPQKPKP